MKDFQLTRRTLPALINALEHQLDESPSMSVSYGKTNPGRWTMTKLFMAWMGTIGAWMAGNGATMPLMIKSDGTAWGNRPFNQDDARELFTIRYLGCDESGNRLSWSKQGKDGRRPATMGERLLCMQKVEAWAAERGIKLMNPRDSEYMKLQRENG